MDSMDFKSYMELLRKLKKLGKTLMCTYCGAETPSLVNMGICSNCESTIHADRSALLGTDPELVKKLDAISKSVEDNDFEAAVKEYGSLKSESDEPSILYAEALAYIKYSNYEVSQISYDRKGFMEENAAHRERGTELMLTAKLLLAKAAEMAAGEIGSGTTSPNLAYTLFLSRLKLGSIRGASEALKQIGGVGGSYVAEYAGVVLSASVGRYDDLIKRADLMIKSNFGSLSLLYYVAFALFKKGDVEESAAILKELKGLSKNANIGSLLEEIESMQKA
jgi:hypothetical protein